VAEVGQILLRRQVTIQDEDRCRGLAHLQQHGFRVAEVDDHDVLAGDVGRRLAVHTRVKVHTVAEPQPQHQRTGDGARTKSVWS
jgi:hypothetical protein